MVPYRGSRPCAFTPERKNIRRLLYLDRQTIGTCVVLDLFPCGSALNSDRPGPLIQAQNFVEMSHVDHQTSTICGLLALAVTLAGNRDLQMFFLGPREHPSNPFDIVHFVNLTYLHGIQAAHIIDDRNSGAIRCLTVIWAARTTTQNSNRRDRSVATIITAFLAARHWQHTAKITNNCAPSRISRTDRTFRAAPRRGENRMRKGLYCPPA